MRNVITPVLLLVALGLSAYADDAIPALAAVAERIPLEGVDGRIDHLAYDPASNRLYVAALGNDSVEVVDVAAGKRVASIAGLKEPTGIRVLPESHNVVVASGGDGNVRVYSPELKLLKTVEGLDDADNVRLDPEGKIVYVGYGDGAIAAIDPERGQKLGQVKLAGHPEAFALEANGKRMFVNVPSAKQIAVVDRDKMAVIATWPVTDATANFPMAIDEVAQRLFIGCRRPAKVLVLDINTGQVVSQLACVGDADDLFLDQSGKHLYVAGGDGVVNVFDRDEAGSFRIRGNVVTAAGARTSLVVPESEQLFVAVPRRGDHGAAILQFEMARLTLSR